MVVRGLRRRGDARWVEQGCACYALDGQAERRVAKGGGHSALKRRWHDAAHRARLPPAPPLLSFSLPEPNSERHTLALSLARTPRLTIRLEHSQMSLLYV